MKHLRIYSGLHLDNKELDTLVFVSRIYFKLGELKKPFDQFVDKWVDSDAEIQKLRQDMEKLLKRQHKNCKISGMIISFMKKYYPCRSAEYSVG